MSEFLDATIKANKIIYEHIKKGFSTNWAKESSVGAGGDISCQIDLYAEEIFIKYLNSFGQIISEESGIVGDGNRKIIIDPIDGSSNILSFFPYYGSSVAILDEDDKVLEAVVVNYANGEIFYKKRGGVLEVASLDSLNFKKEILIKDAKVGLFERSYAYEGIVKKLCNNSLKFRAPGAVALSLSYAHRVNFVIYVGKIRIYDISAGLFFNEDLQVKVSDNYVIVSKENSLLNILEDIVKEEIK